MKDLLDWTEQTAYELARSVDLLRRGDAYAGGEARRNAELLLTLTAEIIDRA